MRVDSENFVVVAHRDARGHKGRQAEPTHLDDISDYIDEIADLLWPVNKKIHDNPELGYKEYIAHEVLTSFLRTRPGWKVTPSAYGLDTAWIAVYDTGKKGPVISYNVEMDALVGIGHACGHNLIATVSVAAALGTAHIVEKDKIPGKLVLVGTPAEEGGGGKIKLLNAGAYKGHDLNLISHPGIVVDSALVRTTAYVRFKAEYFGKEAHAAASPWLGINALDALITAYNALSVLRQQTMPGDIIQGYITDGGIAPNIIHAYAAGEFVVRADRQARLDELKKKVDACFEAGATATGAKLKITPLQAYADHVPNRVLAAHYTPHFNALHPERQIPLDQDVDEIQGITRASSDQGNISYAMPSLSPAFELAHEPGTGGPHNPEFARDAGTRDAFNRALRVGKALAATAVDVLTQEGLLDQVKAKWREDMGAASAAEP